MLNTAFIKDIEVHEESPIQLPGALDAYSTLPSMTAGNTEKSIYRVATEKLNSGKQRRLKLLSAVQPDVCIGAVTTLTKVSRVYPGISWEASKNVIQVSPEVTIIGDPDWSTPVVKLQENASTDAVALSKKVQHTLSQQ
ncbi:p21 antigen protein [Angomonas deanei]|uniref:Uncharacterized protein n=1 Tax=Angomonas deanei TaxID=59799 RepID=A0A7G2CAL5_9TRYP|nr:p21 antigen protein [Angomonas deanei]CAD2216495.1 hypothetical protein, conserved [Angomonas deanei]|eukprot:EPY43536.1 p21 antigen protein [Angomonas deanei]